LLNRSTPKGLCKYHSSKSTHRAPSYSYEEFEHRQQTISFLGTRRIPYNLARGRVEHPYIGRATEVKQALRLSSSSTTIADTATMRPPQESPPESPKSLRSTNSAGKQVCFDKVEIIEFPYQLGDNPAVKSGAPVTIGWESHTRAKFEIDYFEVFEKGERTDLSLSPTQRTKL